MWVDGVGRGHVSRHDKPWTHISIPCIAKEALRPTSKTSTDRGDRSHVAVHEYHSWLFPPIAGIRWPSMPGLPGCEGQSPDRSSCTRPVPCHRRVSSAPLIPVPPPPTHTPTDELSCSMFTTLLRSWPPTPHHALVPIPSLTTTPTPIRQRPRPSPCPHHPPTSSARLPAHLLRARRRPMHRQGRVQTLLKRQTRRRRPPRVLGAAGASRTVT